MLNLWWEALEEAELLKALTVARLIWLRRNDVVFGRGFSPPISLVQKRARMVGDFKTEVRAAKFGGCL